MQNKAMSQETRQLKIISTQLAPLWVFMKLGWYLFLVLAGIGLLTLPFQLIKK